MGYICIDFTNVYYLNFVYTNTIFTNNTSYKLIQTIIKIKNQPWSIQKNNKKSRTSVLQRLTDEKRSFLNLNACVCVF